MMSRLRSSNCCSMARFWPTAPRPVIWCPATGGAGSPRTRLTRPVGVQLPQLAGEERVLTGAAAGGEAHGVAQVGPQAHGPARSCGDSAVVAKERGGVRECWIDREAG